MTRSIFFLASSLASVALGALIACSSGNSGSTSNSSVSAISVSPDPCGVGHTDSIQLSAKATFADGTSEDITKVSDITWTSSNTSVATVDTDGNMVGVSGGTVTITASFEGKTGSAGCVVAP